MKTRSAYVLLALAFMAFALYASLIPFELRRITLAEAWQTLQVALFTWPERVSRSDALANTLMFCPIGFTLMGGLLADRSSRWAAVWSPLIVLPVSLATSLTAEFVQTFTSDRVPTNVDVLSQTVGSVIGIAAWAVAGMPLTRWVRGTLAAAPEDRLGRVLVAYTAVWVFINLAPFDITVDVGDLSERVRNGRINVVPFSGGRVPATRFVWDLLAEILAAIPIGLAVAHGWSRHYRPSPMMAFALGAMLIGSVEAAQAFIQSHSASTTDLIFGCAGVGLGILGARRLFRELPDRARGATRLWMPALAGLAFWCLVLALYHWQPYDFALDRSRIREKLAAMSLIPFAGYARGRWLNALNDMLTKLSLSVPFGAIASFVVQPHGGVNRVMLFAWLGLATAVFGALEFGQLFISTRSPDPTDVLTGVVGTAAGLTVARWAIKTRMP